MTTRCMRYLRWVGLVWFTSFDEEDRGLIQGDLGVSLDRSQAAPAGQ